MSDTEAYSIIFITHYNDLYGANKSLLDLIKGLTQLGITDITVIVPHRGAMTVALKNSGIAFRVIPFVMEIYNYRFPPSKIKMLAKKLYNLLWVNLHYKSLKRDRLIIHSNSSATLAGAYLANKLKAPHVWHIREFGKEDYNFLYNFGEAYFLKQLNKAAAAIAISHTLYNARLTSATCSVKKVIYNGIVSLKNIHPYTPQPANRKTNDAVFTFGIIGWISKEKGQENAIKAFGLLNAYFKYIQLFVAGKGEDAYMAEIKNLVYNNNLTDKVHLKGYIEDTNAFYDSIDCLLMCSANEALGRVTIEAMSKGIPVIGFNNAGTAEIIKHGYNGFLYGSGNEELSEKMRYVIEQYYELDTLRLNAVETVKERFTIERCTAAVKKVYDEILANE